MSAQKIEQLKEMVRCHRAAIDFNTQFCNAVFKVGISLIKKEKKHRRKTAGSIATSLAPGPTIVVATIFVNACISLENKQI